MVVILFGLIVAAVPFFGTDHAANVVMSRETSAYIKCIALADRAKVLDLSSVCEPEREAFGAKCVEDGPTAPSACTMTDDNILAAIGERGLPGDPRRLGF